MRAFVLAAVAATALACGPTPRDVADGGAGLDAAPARDDAQVALDASLDDAGAMSDASLDGASDWGSCAVSGAPGRCVDVASCEGTSTPGFCPGPASVQCCTASPPPDGGSTSTCDPDARPLPNEGLVEEPGEDGCPAGMVRVTDAFCIDRFEASLVEVLGDGSTRGWSPYFEPVGARVRARSLRGAVPQGYVRETQAAAACAEAGKRLCTNAEWLRACQGSSGATYPYGATRMPGWCNDARAQHPAVEYFMTSADWIYSELDHPCLSQLPDSLARTGDHAMCESESGALDMMGNLHEWTSDPAGTFRGGFYVDTARNGPGCLYATTAHDVSHRDYSTGFRCCWSE
ncbi:SUMF1/EgtB/PvdO family nonheme iron enzyme [Sandaracinus amylolyticus]|uniref:Kinase domain protein n=1 Tax=Sandaracinus amylolyticus TaxID=927083 RepID=A0A0F6W1K1_9BACT|nr:SUMF1/EgtB/PvdO family nonheme iron enzyme [Sandaracinus amylolyticus]AKF05156.1 kinase domain protein [Sandaracinus amylolyticus]